MSTESPLRRHPSWHDLGGICPWSELVNEEEMTLCQFQTILRCWFLLSWAKSPHCENRDYLEAMRRGSHGQSWCPTNELKLTVRNHAEVSVVLPTHKVEEPLEQLREPWERNSDYYFKLLRFGVVALQQKIMKILLKCYFKKKNSSLFPFTRRHLKTLWTPKAI